MGVAGRRRPPLPAPTESSAFDTGSESPPPIEPSDLETNLTTRTDKTHFSIPDDGSPVVIKTEKLRAQPKKNITLKNKAKDGSSSQTSLLIEYFEGDKDDPEGSRKPSVRVRVTPSGKKNQDIAGEKTRTGISAAGKTGDRNPVQTRRINLGKAREGIQPLTESNISSFEHSDLSEGPLEVDLGRKDRDAELTRGMDVHGGEDESRLAPINMSEISSMPADSMLATDLGTESPTKPVSRRRSRSLERQVETEDVEKLKPSRQRSRSLSRERMVARRAVEKFEREARERRHKEKERESKSRSGKSKSRGGSGEYLASSSGKARRKSSKSYDKEDDGSNPSLLTGSGLSGNSAQSGASAASSLSKNPKLLQTVEDAIRRLLPEITAMKNEQRGSRRSERYDDELSSNASSARSEERASSRRVSGGKSGPKLKLNGDTIKSSKGSRRSAGKGSVDSLKREFERGASEETVIRDKNRRRSGDKAKDIATGAAVAGLTYAALNSKDSASSIERRERRERRKKRSKSHSRSDSRADSVEDIFNKHDVPPMPMAGGLTDSDLTRESILSERTSTPTNDRNKEVRDLVRDSPNEPSPGGSITPTRQTSPSRNRDIDYSAGHGFGESIHLKKEPYHANLQDEYLEEDEDEENYEPHPAGHYAEERSYVPMMDMYSANNYSDPAYGFQRRGLSPIQSVASYEERGEPPPENLQHQQSSTSVSSVDRDLRPEDSYDSLPRGAAGAHQFARESNGNAKPGFLGQDIRQLGANAELIDSPHRAESAVASLMDHSTAGERSNLSYGSSDKNSPSKRFSVESDPRRDSIISQDRSLHTPERSSPLKRELRHDELDESLPPNYGYHGRPSGTAPMKDLEGNSAASSPFEVNPISRGNLMPSGENTMADVDRYDEDVETNPSEIRDDPWDGKQTQHSNSTHDSLRVAAKNMLLAANAMGTGAVALHDKGNPSDYDQMDLDSDSPRHSESPGDRDMPESPSMHDKKAAPGVSPWQPLEFTPLPPLEGKDEGYSSGMPRDVPPSDGSITPEAVAKPEGLFGGMDFGGDVAADPFRSPKRDRPTTADSSAMPNPLYDAATGRGVDRIKNQDVVALMDHLTVRDAQRNARDTEILVTLVRSAADMRNSFEDMKRMMATQEERVLDSNNKQHVETRKAIGGPRAMPISKPGSSRASAAEMNADDGPAKKTNLLKKALRGFGGGKKENLANIEDMLMHLLDEVAEIKAGQQLPPSGAGVGVIGGGYVPPKMSSGLTSYEQLRDAPQDVYQPVGKTMGGAQNDSGYSSGNSSYRPMHNRIGSESLRTGQNRVSTVPEDDEEDGEDSPETPLDEREQNLLGNAEADEMLTPTREFRGASLATGAPQTSRQQSLSADNTPNTRKHRSGSSTFFPPKISRWSKTTASSVPGLDQTPRQEQGQTQYSQQTPSKQRGQRPVSDLSRSASDLGDADYDVRDHYDPHGDDRLRSKTSLSNHSTSKEYRPPSPLIPSTVSEKPTYSAHRDSKDLQHPQPRQGPTARFQNHLESEAARGWFHDNNAAVAESPTSDVMGSNPVLSRFGGRERGDRYSGASYGAHGAEELGTIAEAASTNSTSAGPPLPPKIKDGGPLVPSKVPTEQQQQQGPSNTRMVSFASDRMAQITGGAQTRKPTGPRPITRTGSSSPAAGQSFSDWKKKTQYRGSPDHIPSDDDSETF